MPQTTRAPNWFRNVPCCGSYVRSKRQGFVGHVFRVVECKSDHLVVRLAKEPHNTHRWELLYDEAQVVPPPL